MNSKQLEGLKLHSNRNQAI